MRAVFLSSCVVFLVVIAPEAWSAVINKDVCRKGAVYVGGQCLSFSTDALSWHEAKKACSSLHGQLVTLNDPYAVLGYVDHHYDAVPFWTGGSDIATEGNWVWLTGEAFVHFPWSPPEPNNLNNEDCLLVNEYDGFNDRNCDVAFKYICEYEVPGQAWRNDLRCGESYLAPNGKPAECDPSGKRPCCSGAGWCGNSGAHCECEGCVDYRVSESDDSSEELECPEGFFFAPGSYQCFKYFGEKRLNWFDANIKCGENGLRLAKPFNALALRAYLVERYGPDARVHVGARGIGSKMVWEHDGRELGEYNTLWRNSQPGNKVTSDYCLEISARDYEMSQEPEKPYWPGLCSVEIYTLCEFVE